MAPALRTLVDGASFGTSICSRSGVIGSGVIGNRIRVDAQIFDALETAITRAIVVAGTAVVAALTRRGICGVIAVIRPRAAEDEY